jgi:3-oxoacyl-[acyl-carrier protein] reductase
MKRVALVTGASRGIGKAIALKLAAMGHRVAVNYRDSGQEAAAVVKQIRDSGGEATAIQADLADPRACRELASHAASLLGPVEILVNNAAVLRRGDLSDFDFSQMEGMRAVNVDGLVRVTRSVIDDMKMRRWGRIVNLTSVAALGTTMPGTTFYAATKAAVIVLTRRFALELGPHGITVNAVAPGFILTDMVGVGRTPEQLASLIEAVAQKAMVRRAGQPEDIANAVAFLASEDSGFLTAQVLTVDGGRTDYIAHP